ncbi:hypothetical protein DI487_03105 [Flavobacterium sediminis]|uniref:Sugar-binding protein n=1 Tax=Flavobacterium sediminis TaxID=2201181 RepID=A0A2U8QS18_9FLAO|nr:RHS repeat protein [Flavobacterium sediminis]AWM12953.1 hypothetical protein DI487_03105 [Flavobacterium sediminis]
MIKYKLITAFCLFLSFLGYGQEELELPDYAVPSPQSNGLAQFGDLNIDESSGKFSHTISVFNYPAGSINVPVGLTYMGNGVKVEENPDWTGMNWNLNAGGVITRTVRDLPDETTYPSYHYSPDQIADMFQSGEIADMDDFGFFVEDNKNYDSEADVFSFNFLGYSGTFYLEKDSLGNYSAKLSKYESEFKVELLGNFSAPNGFYDFGDQSSNNPHYEFKFTGPDGTTYFFGGVVTSQTGADNFEAVEETELFDHNPLHQSMRAKTAFYLTKIESFNGDTVYFTYETIPSYYVYYKKNQKVSKIIYSESEPGCEGSSSTPENNMQTLTVRNKIFNGKFLKQIWSPQNGLYVDFTSTGVYEQVTPITTNLKYKVLSQISYGTNTFNLSYSPSLTQLASGDIDKFFLVDTNMESSSGTTTLQYTFEYEDLNNIPGVNSNAQDYLGYFNGVTANANLLPKNAEKLFSDYLLLYITPETGPLSYYDYIYEQSKFSEIGNLADREPYFDYATNGCLKKITYPTGGYTLIDYEPEDKKTVYADKELQINFDPVFGSDMEDELLLSNYTVVFSGNDFYEVYNDLPGIPEEQTVELTLTFTGSNTNVATLDYRDFAYVEITNITTDSVFTKNLHFPAEELMNSAGQTSFTTQYAFNYTFKKQDKYNIKIGFGDNYAPNEGYINDPNTTMLTPNLFGKLEFKYLDGYDPDDGLGIRVKRIVDYTASGETASYKRYYYSNIQKLDDTGIKKYYPLFHSFSLEGTQGFNQGTQSNCMVLSTYMEMNSQLQAFNLPVLYGALEEERTVSVSLGGENFEKGGYEKDFYTQRDEYQEFFNPAGEEYGSYYSALAYTFKSFNNAATNTSAVDGLLLRERLWERTNSAPDLRLQKETCYDYHINFFHQNPNMLYVQMFQSTFGFTGNATNLGSMYMGYYFNNTYKPELRWKVETDFLSDVSVWDYFTANTSFNLNQLPDYSSFDTRTLRTDYLDNINNIYSGMPGHIKTTNSSGEILEVKNYYPTDYFLGQLTNLSGSELTAYGALETANRIAQPIYVESFKNTGKTSAVKYIYEQPDANLPFLLSKVQSAKEDQSLEDRIIYAKYDDNGNPVEVQKEKGVKVVYIWSESRKPLYKVVNSDYDTVMAALTASGITLGNGFSGATISANQTLINQSTLATAQVYCYRYNMYDLIVQMVQPNGNYIDYQYDAFNRLQNVKDKDGNILSENEIHYTSDN